MTKYIVNRFVEPSDLRSISISDSKVEALKSLYNDFKKTFEGLGGKNLKIDLDNNEKKQVSSDFFLSLKGDEAILIDKTDFRNYRWVVSEVNC